MSALPLSHIKYFCPRSVVQTRGGSVGSDFCVQVIRVFSVLDHLFFFCFGSVRRRSGNFCPAGVCGEVIGWVYQTDERDEEPRGARDGLLVCGDRLAKEACNFLASTACHQVAGCWCSSKKARFLPPIVVYSKLCHFSFNIGDILGRIGVLQKRFAVLHLKRRWMPKNFPKS